MRCLRVTGVFVDWCDACFVGFVSGCCGVAVLIDVIDVFFIVGVFNLGLGFIKL